jgi:hypothetical protein
MKPTTSTRWFYIIACTVCITLLWFTSGVVRTRGLTIFGCGLLGLAACAVVARWWRLPFFIFSLALTIFAVVIASAECVLRAVPGLLTGSIANCAYGGYHCESGGIYKRDRHLGLALRRNCSREIYWNGHWWHHATNSEGYRGAAVAHADAVFLGDSMVYGHGVEEDQTVPHCFGVRAGCTVANFGQQGTCLIQMAMRMRHIGVGLKPRVVFACSHFNDIEEATGWYPESEVERFVRSSPSEHYEPVARPSCWPYPWWRIDRRLWDAQLAPALRVAGVVPGWRAAAEQGSIQWKSKLATDCSQIYVPSPELIAQPFTPWDESVPPNIHLGWLAHRKALAQIHDLCKRNGAELVLFDLGYPSTFSRAIEQLAEEMGVAYSPAGRVALERAQAGEETYLANDGHWSARGSEIVATELLKTLHHFDLSGTSERALRNATRSAASSFDKPNGFMTGSRFGFFCPPRL